jgi:hypothetical protein
MKFEDLSDAQLKRVIKNYRLHLLKELTGYTKMSREDLINLCKKLFDIDDEKIKPKITEPIYFDIPKGKQPKAEKIKKVIMPLEIKPEPKSKADEIAISNIKEPVYRKLDITQATNMKEKYNKLFKSTLKTEEENYFKKWSVKDLFDVKEKLLSVSANDKIFKDVVKKYNLYNLNEPDRITKKKPYKTLKEAVLSWFEENRFSMSEELRNLKNIIYNLTDKILEEKRNSELYEKYSKNK